MTDNIKTFADTPRGYRGGVRQPILSLVLPVYKAEKYLTPCLDSILAALKGADAKESVEVFCIDDGSPDRCGEILEAYRARFEDTTLPCRVKYEVVHQKNAGASGARNEGLIRAQGEWIWFIDPDDAIAPFSFSFLMRVLREHPVDVLRFGYREVPTAETPFTAEERGLVFYDLTKSEDVRLAVSRHSLWLVIWCACFRRAAIGDVRSHVGMLSGEDLLFAAQVDVRSKTLATTGTVLYNYVQRPDSCMKSLDLQKLRSTLERSRLQLETIRGWSQGAVALPFFLKGERDWMCWAHKAIKQLPPDDCRQLMPLYYAQFARLYADCPVRRTLFRLHCGWLVLLCQSASLAVRKNLLRLGVVRRLKVFIRGY